MKLKLLYALYGLCISQSVNAKEVEDDDFSETKAGTVSEEKDVILAPKFDLRPFNEIEDVTKQESRGFQAETERLMQIIINSLYTERDVFFRELVSNAADALEKVRVLSLQHKDKGFKSDKEDLHIFVSLDKARRLVTITDTGVGMCRKELEQNLGVVAKSGTLDFINAAKQGASPSNLIGQFGVGFYSAFLVAENVTVVSKCVEDPDWYIWVSSGAGNYTIAKHPKGGELPHGTTVIISMKDDALEYLDEAKVKSIMSRFSEFVPFPIYVGSKKPGSPDEPKWTRVNEHKPLWLRDKSNITEAEYQGFYKSISKDYVEPLAWTHFRAEGDIEFTSLLFIPKHSRQMTSLDEGSASLLKLYVQRVLISDRLQDFLPRWMGFIRGILDSNDLPLKVDRETFTQTRVMRSMKSKIISKTFELLRQLGKDSDEHVDEYDAIIAANVSDFATAETTYPISHKWNRFWDVFGPTVTLSCVEEPTSKQLKKVREVFAAHSSKTEYGRITLDKYISRMKPGQKSIYYVTGDTVEVIKRVPYLEIFTKSDVEVLFLTGPYEEMCLSGSIKEYRDYKLVSIEKDDFKPEELAFVNAGSDETSLEEEKRKMIRQFELAKIYYKPLTDWVKEHIKTENAQQVHLGKTLVDSPATITSPEHGFTAVHERMARTSVSANKLMVEAYARMKTFELNPNHPLIKRLQKEVLKFTEDKLQASPEAAKLNHTIDVLYESATIAAGFPARRAHILVADLFKTITASVPGVDMNDIDPVVIPQDIQDDYDAKEASKESLFDEKTSDDDDDDDDDFTSKDEL